MSEHDFLIAVAAIINAHAMGFFVGRAYQWWASRQSVRP